MSGNNIKILANVGKAGDEGWKADTGKVDAMRVDGDKAAHAQEIVQKDAPKAPAQTSVKTANALAQNPSVKTDAGQTNNTTQAPQANPNAVTERSRENAPEPARPTPGAQQAATTYAAVSTPSASNVLKQLETRQAPKVDVRQDLRPDAGVSTATAGAVNGKGKTDGAQVQQYQPNQTSPTNPTASVKQNLRRVVSDQVKQNQPVDGEVVKILDQHGNEIPVQAGQIANAEVPKPRTSNVDLRERTEKKDKKEEGKRTGVSSDHTRTAKANRDLSGLETGVGADAGGSESQEFGHLTEIPLTQVAAAIPEEASNLAIYSVDALGPQGEIAAAYLHKATVLKNEIIKDFGARLGALASENAALDLALVPLRERVANGELKTSDFLRDVNGIGIIG